MGLQNQLSDVSSESILVLMVVLIARSVSYLHSLLFTILHNLVFFYPRPQGQGDTNQHFGTSFYDVVGSGLANLIVLCDQLKLNRDCSYRNQSDGVDGLDADCVVCLNRLGEGDHVRRLACGHVFHKHCLEGWLEHLNFNCPICRATLVSAESVDCTQKTVNGDLLT